MKWTNVMKEYPDETGCKAVWKKRWHRECGV